MNRLSHFALVVALASGCGDDATAIDAGADTSTLDGAIADSSTPDSSTPDSNTPDSSTADGGSPDSATLDGSIAVDSGADSGAGDSGAGDSGTDDAGDACIADSIEEACNAMGRDCGGVDDGCGSPLDCGTCTAPATCGGSGTDNVCGGATRSIAAGDVIVSEVHYDSTAAGDLFGEWFELHNTSADALDLDGCELTDDGSDFHVIDNDGTLSVPAGGYIVLGISDNVLENGGAPVDYAYGSTPTGLSAFPLANIEDQIVLTCDGVEIDRLAWDERGTPEWPDLRGASLSLSSTALDAVANDDRLSWCAAASAFGEGDLGTPGEANDACPAPIATCTMTMEAGMCPDSVFACSTDMAGGDGCIAEGLTNCYASGTQAYRVDDGTGPVTIVFNGTVSSVDLLFSIAETGDFGEIRFYDEGDDLVGRLIANGPCATGPMPAVQSADLDAPAVRAEVMVLLGTVYLDSFTLNPR